MIDGIVPTRVIRQRPGALPAKVRPDTAQLARYPDTVGFYNNDPDRNIHLEISWNDFGLEEVYGRFMKAKIYSLDPAPLCGVLVDLYV